MYRIYAIRGLSISGEEEEGKGQESAVSLPCSQEFGIFRKTGMVAAYDIIGNPRYFVNCPTKTELTRNKGCITI